MCEIIFKIGVRFSLPQSFVLKILINAFSAAEAINEMEGLFLRLSLSTTHALHEDKRKLRAFAHLGITRRQLSEEDLKTICVRIAKGGMLRTPEGLAYGSVVGGRHVQLLQPLEEFDLPEVAERTIP